MRGWRELTNGALAQAASREGFRVLLTRDRRFGASAGSTLKALPELAIVIVTLSQVREAAYLSAFRTADHIYGKLRVDSRVALTLYAQDGGLVWSRESGPAFSEAILECWSKNRRAIFLVGPR